MNPITASSIATSSGVASAGGTLPGSKMPMNIAAWPRAR